MQNNATQQVNTVLAGGRADLSQVMISVEKADVAFQLMMQVRNKVCECVPRNREDAVLMHFHSDCDRAELRATRVFPDGKAAFELPFPGLHLL